MKRERYREGVILNRLRGFLGDGDEAYGLLFEWMQHIISCVSIVSYSFKINGQVKGLVNPSWDLRQGDPISSYLFLLYAKAFSGLLTKAVNEKFLNDAKISGTTPQVSHQLFPNDSVLFIRGNIQECKRLADIISCYVCVRTANR